MLTRSQKVAIRRHDEEIIARETTMLVCGCVMNTLRAVLTSGGCTVYMAGDIQLSTAADAISSTNADGVASSAAT
jgi:hypothetical protein